ncbi:MAG: GumC family protein [Kofleriaceae bacterium]
MSFDIGRYLAALRRYAWLVIALVVVSVTAAVFYTRRQPEIFEATSSVQIEPRMADLLGQAGDFVGVRGGGAEYYRQQRLVLGSLKLMRETVVSNNLHTKLLTEKERGGQSLEQQYDLAARRLQNAVTIRYPEQNRIMYVVVASRDPKLAQDIANAHVATYEAYSRGLLTTGTQQASSALSAEFAVAEKALRAADEAIHEFQKRNQLPNVSDIENRQSIQSSKMMTYMQKLNDAHSRSKELEVRLQILRQAASGKDIVDSPILSMADSTAFDAMRAQYYTAKNAFEELQREVGPKTIEYARQKAQVDSLRSTLEAEARRVIGAAEKQYQAAIQFEREMANEVEKCKDEALALGPKILEYNELTREKKNAEDKYNILVGRLSTSQMTDHLSKNLDGNVRPLDPAQLPTTPVSPNLRINIMVATGLALVVGLSIVFLIVFLDRSIKSAEDAQNSASAAVLGVVPSLGEEESSGDDRGRDLYVHEHPKSQVAEACRSLRTNLVFSGADRQFKTLVVSSANPREGKTTLVIYLGTTMAQSGERVLLVDTDMRRPRLHISTGVPRGIGLSNLIVGDGSYEDAIKSSAIPNLFVLPCGPLPPNPAELLMSKKFAGVLEELAKRFDRVILDSPPLGAVTDAVVLSKQTDGVALVVQAGKTLRDEVKRSVRQIRHVDGQVVGVILNQLDRHDRRYGYYSYYGYGEKVKGPVSAS